MTYTNATITKKANVYHNGKVSSRSIITEQGETKTLGFMLAGDYHFNTDAAEIMEVLAGSCVVRLSGSNAWQTYSEGQSFDVPEKSAFDIKIDGFLDYICHYEA